jgi:MFS family permease
MRGFLVRTFAMNAVYVTANKFTFLEALLTQEMFLVAFVFFCVEITGLVFLSSAADMVQNTFGLTATEAASTTSYLNLVNFAGRVGWGLVSDKVGRKSFYIFSALAQAVAVGTMVVSIPLGAAGYGGWLASFLVVGSLYGGGFGVIPAFVSDLFGPQISAATHGVMIGVWAAAAIIGIPCFTTYTSTDYRLSGATKITNPSAYVSNVLWLCALPTAGFFAALFINVKKEDRELRVAKGDVRVRVFDLVVRFNAAEGGEVVSLSTPALTHSRCRYPSPRHLTRYSSVSQW